MKARKVKALRRMMKSPHYWGDRLIDAVYFKCAFEADYFRALRESEDEEYALKMKEMWTRRESWYRKKLKEQKEIINETETDIPRF